MVSDEREAKGSCAPSIAAVPTMLDSAEALDSKSPLA